MNIARRTRQMLAYATLTLALTLVADWWLAQQQRAAVLASARTAAHQHVLQQIDLERLGVSALTTIATRMKARPDLTPATLADTTAILPSPPIAAIFIAESVFSEKKAEFVGSMRSLLPDYQIRERRNGKLLEAGSRQSYLPVILSSGKMSDLLPPGLDLLEGLSAQAPLAMTSASLQADAAYFHAVCPDTAPPPCRMLMQATQVHGRTVYLGAVLAPRAGEADMVKLPSRYFDTWLDISGPDTVRSSPASAAPHSSAILLAQLDFTAGERRWRLESRSSADDLSFPGAVQRLPLWLLAVGLLGLVLWVARKPEAPPIAPLPIDPSHTQEAEIQQLLNQAIETASVAQRDNLRLKTILDTANEAVVLIDQRGLIELFNNAAERMFGYRAEEVLGSNVNILMPSSQRKKHDDSLERFVATGHSKVVGTSRELLAQARDGHAFPIDLSLNEFRLADKHYFVGVMRDISDRKRTERVLLESELKHRAILDAAFIGIYVQQNGKLRFVNPTFCNYFDLRSSDIIDNKALEHLVAPVSRVALGEALSLSVSSGRPTELVMERPDGSRFYALLTAKPILFDHKQGIAGSLLDISERKAAEEAMLRAEIKNVAILDAIPDLMIHLDMNGMVLDSRIGGSGEASFGVARDINGSHYKRVLPPDLSGQLDALLRSPPWERPRSFEYVIPVANDTHRSFEARVTPMGDGEQLVMVRDISERKAIEAELIQHRDHFAELVKERTAELNSLFATSPLATLLLSRGEILEVNNAFVNLFGYSRPELIGKGSVTPVSARESFERINPDVYPRLASGDVVSFETRYRKASGMNVLCEVFGKAVNAEDPNLGSIWVYQDISERRAAELALKQAKEIAEAANEAKTEFLANMSHELRTPMHAVLSFAELGAGKSQGPGQEKLLHYFERIRQSGQRLLQMLNDLLDLSKLDAGKMRYEMRMARLEPVFEDILDELATLARPRNIRIAFQPASNSPSICVDPQRMGQVLRNLVANAVKFSPDHGEIKVDIEYAETDVRITVCDEGIGIPEEELERIFDKFTQSTKTKTGAGGTGLGLAICREIIGAHGGSIRAENRDEGGARFIAVIPRRDPDA